MPWRAHLQSQVQRKLFFLGEQVPEHKVSGIVSGPKEGSQKICRKPEGELGHTIHFVFAEVSIKITGNLLCHQRAWNLRYAGIDLQEQILYM